MLLAVRTSSYGCTWEVWRALKKLELLSAAPRATLTLLSCSPNFPRASITRCTHAKHEPIDHFHYDVTHAKVSGSCSKDRAQGRSIAGKFKIIHKNTCNAMAAELVHRITSIISIFERTSSDISDKPAFTHQNTSRDNIVKVRKLYFAIFSTFF